LVRAEGGEVEVLPTIAVVVADRDGDTVFSRMDPTDLGYVSKMQRSRGDPLVAQQAILEVLRGAGEFAALNQVKIEITVPVKIEQPTPAPTISGKRNSPCIPLECRKVSPERSVQSSNRGLGLAGSVAHAPKVTTATKAPARISMCNRNHRHE